MLCDTYYVTTFICSDHVHIYKIIIIYLLTESEAFTEKILNQVLAVFTERQRVQCGKAEV